MARGRTGWEDGPGEVPWYLCDDQLPVVRRARRERARLLALHRMRAERGEAEGGAGDGKADEARAADLAAFEALGRELYGERVPTWAPLESVPEDWAARELLACAHEGTTARVRRLLLEARADPDARDAFGFEETALHRAALRGWVCTARALLAAGARAHPPLPSARARAARAPRAEAAAGRAGADPNARDVAGETPAHNAVSQAREDVLRVLLAGGADISVPDNDGMVRAPPACPAPRGAARPRAVLRPGGGRLRSIWRGRWTSTACGHGRATARRCTAGRTRCSVSGTAHFATRASGGATSTPRRGARSPSNCTGAGAPCGRATCSWTAPSTESTCRRRRRSRATRCAATASATSGRSSAPSQVHSRFPNCETWNSRRNGMVK